MSNDLFIGRHTDTGEPLIYDGDDLTTHGVIVGMTGAGKTGLGVAMLEEALLNGVPCLIIDPKGDMGNLGLAFPSLRPEDFEPWVDPTEADRSGKSVDEVAAKVAAKFRRRLEREEIDEERMTRFVDNSQVTIYTPGSQAGVGLNVLGSMRAPEVSWDTHAEVIREEIQSLVSSVLALAGIDSDPVSGAEHILLCTIVETWWRQGTNLDLATLIGQIPSPPFRKLGVFEVDDFVPEKARTSLALRLNGLLASPSFASWMEGVPLDIDRLLGGSPTRAAIVYLAHLTDEERQFIVTLLLSKLVTWMRGLSGTSQLRALVYMDEMYGFAPPTQQPPSKKPILTILKQARAHGVGMVVSTQNPVDLDYKAMSNAGTWMIGRLQTENDRKRIVEALAAAGSVDSTEIHRLISGLGKRQFLLHTTRGGAPEVFTARRTMSYRPGPLTRDQLTLLRGERGEEPAEPVAPSPPTLADDVVPVPPKVATGRPVAFLDAAAPWSSQIGADPTGTTFEAAVAARVELLYKDTRAGIEHREEFEAVLFPLDGSLDEHEVIAVDHDDRDFREEAPFAAGYRIPDVDLTSAPFWSGLQSQLKDHLVAHRPVRARRNIALRLYSRVDETEEVFAARCSEAAETAADAVVAKLRERYQTRIDRVRDQLQTAETRVDAAEQDVAAQKQNELISGAGDLLGTLLGGRTRSNPLGNVASRRAATQKARARAETETSKLTAKQRELVDLEDQLAEEITRIVDQHHDLARQIEEFDVAPDKSGTTVAELKLVWVPVASAGASST